jgi:acetate kinase
MNILVVNCGSSSIKLELIAVNTGDRLQKVILERVSDNQPTIKINSEPSYVLNITGYNALLRHSLNLFKDKFGLDAIHGIGHRVVHGGSKFDQPVLIDSDVELAIKSMFSLAPLHNPPNLTGIEVAKEIFPEVSQVAVFDTSFHQTVPSRAYTYALPKNIREKHGIRRYGFHGCSHQYVSDQTAKILETDIRNLRLITCHLGNGASVTAVEYGKSVETSMGFTPLEGLVMGSRPGDLDAGILLHLAKEENLSLSDLDKILNKESGLKGLSAHSNDMRDIIEKASEGDEDCRLAIAVFTHRLRKYIGAYAAVMGGADAIVFTGGIGENSHIIRQRVCQRLDFMGVSVDEDANMDLKLSSDRPFSFFSNDNSRVKLLAIKTDEEKVIAVETSRIIKEEDKVNTIPAIPIAISARHLHLTQEVVEKLFGVGHQLTVKSPLSQPGQFAANETVTIVGPKNQIDGVRILGPCRNLNQLEISRTDEFFLGVDAPIRASGKIENTPGIKLIGPMGEVHLKEGVICAWRHIHMTNADAEILGVNDGDIVEVQVNNNQRPLTFGNVLVRVSDSFKLEMHIDTDEANAAELTKSAEGELLNTEGNATLIKKKLAKNQ